MDRPELDHLVYATPDLEATIAQLERVSGVRAIPGGSHPGEGTRNALIGLGPGRYLEIVGPDRGQPDPGRLRWFGIDALEGPRLTAWAVRTAELERIALQAGLAGAPLGAVTAGSRRRLDGTLLSWRFTDPHEVLPGGVIPFLIDWGESPHPAQVTTGDLSVLELRAEHPDPAWVGKVLEALEVELPLSMGERAALVATLMTPRGRLQLR